MCVCGRFVLVIMIQMLRVGPGAGWRTLGRRWWLTSSLTLGCWRRWWAPASSCSSWCSWRFDTGTSGSGTAWLSSASGASAVCSVPLGLSFSFPPKPQKPSSSSSVLLTLYKVRGLILVVSTPLFMWRRGISEQNVPIVCPYKTSLRFRLEFIKRLKSFIWPRVYLDSTK